MAFVAPVVTGFSAAISGASVCRSRAVPRPASASTVSMKVSQAMPFMESPAALDDSSIVGNVGFDPFNFSSTFDLRWMQEAEIKHGRVAMLGVLGILIPELLRFPGVKAMNPADAHSFFVKTGSMSQILLWTSFFEVFGVYALAATLDGERAPGDFAFDPLGMSKDPKTKARFQLAEIKNGRLAMCATGGLIHAGFVSKQGVFEQLAHFKGVPVSLY